MINSDNLCMSCMKDIGGLKTCPHCGFHSDTPQITPYLPIRTVLGNRYIIGKLLNYNGDGATYIGLDLTTRLPVNIREFYPVGIARRSSKTFAVSPNEQSVALFNECMHSFMEMWRKLMRLSGLSALIKVHDVLEGNGTCYAITEHIDGITLREYLLRNNVGYISWEKARPLLMPVLSTLGTLHSSGIIHRGISPSTLIVAPDGKIRITGFSISQVRSAKSELKQQLFNGYAAFEQYGFEGRQGPWTDIYGFGAVLYRTLIGTDPIDATERVTNDRLMVPGKFAEQLPAYVINGLVNALQILPEDRTRSVEELRAELSASPSAAAGASRDINPVPPVTPQKYQMAAQRLDFEKEEEDFTAEKREAAQRRHNASTAVVAAALVIIIAIVAVLALEFTGVINIFSEETTTTTTASAKENIPNLVGRDYYEVINDEYNKKHFTFAKNEVYDATHDEGVIIGQSVTPGTSVGKNDVITLTVSMGTEMIEFPKGIIGMKYEDAKKLLESKGFVVDENPTMKPNGGGNTAGTVADHPNFTAGTQHERGTKVLLSVWAEEMIKFPSGLEGMSYEYAKSILESRGFTVAEAVTVENTGEYTEGTVSGHPGFTADEEYVKGTEVTLNVWGEYVDVGFEMPDSMFY